MTLQPMAYNFKKRYIINDTLRVPISLENICRTVKDSPTKRKECKFGLVKSTIESIIRDLAIKLSYIVTPRIVSITEI